MWPDKHKSSPLKAYLPQFLLPEGSCLAFNEKITRNAKAKKKKNSLKRQKQALEPDLDMTDFEITRPDLK